MPETPQTNGTSAAPLIEADPVRPLPNRRAPGTIEIWGRQLTPVQVAGAGVAAGAVAVAVARVARPSGRRVPRRGLFRRREKIVGRRSFLVDVHVLGR